MAVTRKNRVITMTALNDEIEGKFYVQKVMHYCSAAPFTVTLTTGADLDEVWCDMRGAQNVTLQADFDPPLCIEDMKLTSKGGGNVYVYIA